VLQSLIKSSYLSLRRLALLLLVRKPRKQKLAKPLSSLLVISERRLGDVSLEIPVLRRFRAIHPETFFALIAPVALHPLLRWSCQPNLLLDFAERELVRDRLWDAAIDLTGDYYLSSAQIVASSRASLRIGFEYGGRGQYFNVALPLSASEHMTEMYERPFAILGLNPRGSNPADPLPFLPPPAPGRHAVGIHPGAHHETQRWPSHYFAKLIRVLHSDGVSCVVLGAPSEREIVQNIVNASGRTAAQMITTDVMSLASALQNVDVLICNNSGPLHLAGLLGVPTLSFMGPTVREKWQPRRPCSLVLRRDELPCIGCNLSYCKIQTHACMIDITPDMVFAAYTRFKSQLLEGTLHD
jgi:ADP-heptose:LPS heptosyltransferase